MCQGKVVRPRQFKGHAKRLKRGMKACKPGELVQIDHMSVYVDGLGQVKYFNAICSTTKKVVLKVYDATTSQNAAVFLENVIRGFPFQVKSIQVDGGSEFRRHFENSCEAHGISLYVTPSISPECNGHVERVNGTFKYEFYSQYKGAGSIPILWYEHTSSLRPRTSSPGAWLFDTRQIL